ncbi:hypothetical protein HELRODRAFT_150887, partial [Helobdella robusta]|uniref:protein-tyrosine-phosphatase n=1 Tax=Helobdella robusta TaxID=6412 RepID=T1EKH8_HELRO
GPIPSTTIDFWNMICKYNVKVIVMLAQCFEDGKNKCNAYWPDGEDVKFGTVKISLKSEKKYTHYTLRHLEVESLDKTMTVVQMQYVTWPDKGVPRNLSSILSLWQKVSAHRKDNEFLVVHCSAGVGRTGTFIAMNYLMKQLENEGSVDILGCMSRLREDRPQMIQTLEQYKLCFSSILLHHLVGTTSI